MKKPDNAPEVTSPDPELAEDLLRGADEIAEFVFGKKLRRRIYYLAESTVFPVFRIGSMLCARKSVVLRWIAGQESRIFRSTD